MATTTFSVIGLILAVVLLAPPIYVYCDDKDYARLFPLVKVSKQFLQYVTEENLKLNDAGESMVGSEVYDDDDGLSEVDVTVNDHEYTPREKYR